jgi:cytoskeleton protein RodZ
MEEGRHNPARGEEASEETGIGRLLEHKRKEQGLSLEEVEQATKIRKRYLTGLEHDDYAVLPDAVYARGFLKTYANYLGLDGEAFARELKSTRKPRREQRGIDYNSRPETDFEQPLMSAGGLAGTRKRKVSTSAIVTLLVALLVLAAVIGALYFVGRGVQASKDDTPAAPPRQEQQKVADREKSAENRRATEDDGGVEENAEDKEKPAGAGQSVLPDTLQVAIDVKERPSWILIRADGTTAYEQIAQPGFSQTFEAERELYIKSGDAGAVKVEINGQDVGALGPAYEIVARNYTLKNAS